MSTASPTATLSFDQLWNNHPTVAGDKYPCRKNGTPTYSDQCAIRVGVALRKSGFDLGKPPFASLGTCGLHPGEGHVLLAQSLATALQKYSNLKGALIGKTQVIDPKTFNNDIDGKTGIIFLADFWARKGETNTTRSGDHIDVWNKNRLTQWYSWARVQLLGSIRLQIMGNVLVDWDDYKGSSKILFWEVP